MAPRVGFFFQAEDGIRDVLGSRGLGDVYKRQAYQASLMYYYNLSKRTQLYSGVSYSDGDKLLDTVDRFNQIFGTVGLQHRF